MQQLVVSLIPPPALRFKGRSVVMRWGSLVEDLTGFSRFFFVYSVDSRIISLDNCHIWTGNPDAKEGGESGEPIPQASIPSYALVTKPPASNHTKCPAHKVGHFLRPYPSERVSKWPMLGAELKKPDALN